LLLAGLQVIPRDLYEAAEVDGAKPLQQFWKITLPLLWPAIFVTLIFRTLDALRVVDVFYVFFGHGLGTQYMAIYAQSTIVGDGYVGYGAAISMAIFIVIALFVVIYLTSQRVVSRVAHPARQQGASSLPSAGAVSSGAARSGSPSSECPSTCSSSSSSSTRCSRSRALSAAGSRPTGISSRARCSTSRTTPRSTTSRRRSRRSSSG